MSNKWIAEKYSIDVLINAIFEWYINKYDESDTTQQIKSIKILNKEWTKVGFMISLVVDKNLPAIDYEDSRRSSFPLRGPDIESEDIEFGGGALLWGKEGYINCLELYANENYFKDNIKEFTLIGS